MLKLIGALIVIAASSVFGFYQASSYGKRLTQIKQLIYSLKRLKTDIQFGLTPLPDAFLHISTNTAQPFNLFFQRLSERLLKATAEIAFIDIWEQELQEIWVETDLKQHHFDILMQLGTVLGTSDVVDQQQHLQTAIERLVLEEAVAGEEQVKYASLWRSLGALTGVTLVILLI